MDDMTVKCPQCKVVADHVFAGMQDIPTRKDGKPFLDDNGNIVTHAVQMWTCGKCKSTWVKVK